MRSRSFVDYLKLTALLLVQCAGSELPPPPHPDVLPLRHSEVTPAPAPAGANAASLAPPTPPAAAAEVATSTPEPVPEPAVAEPRCAGIPPLGPDGAVPPAPPHTPLGEELEIEGDRSAYVLPGNPGDRRVILYLHGMCGDITAPDYFREALRERGTLLALRGDTHCSGERYKWRDGPPRIRQRIEVALARLNAARSTDLSLEGVVLFGYSQGADRAEKLAQRYPKLFPRVVLGGPPMRASATRLAAAERVAIFGGELETTENMRAGADALQGAGIACRYFTLDCAYHGYYGTRAEVQLAEVLDWVTAR